MNASVSNSATAPQADKRRSSRSRGGRSASPPRTAYPFDLQARLLEAETMTEILDVATSMLARVPGTIGAWIYQRSDAGLLVLVSSWKASNADVSPMPSEELGQMIHQRWIAAHRLGHSASDFSRPFTPPGSAASLVAPMMIGEELVGTVAVERRDGEVFAYAGEDTVIIAAVAALTAQQMQSAVLRNRAAESIDEQYVDQLNQEYRRIAHDLHDGIVQDLAYLRLRLETLERLISAEPDRASAETRQIRQELNNSIDNLRSMIANFRRPRQRTRGITGELRDLASHMAARPIAAEQPRLELNLSEISGVRLAPEVERAVVGIVREALQNIRKHAQADSVRVEVQRADDELLVIVLDDGSGLSEAQAEERRGQHFGLEQMRELAEDMGGSLRIAQGEERGTRVEARIPIAPGGKGKV